MRILLPAPGLAVTTSGSGQPAAGDTATMSSDETGEPPAAAAWGTNSATWQVPGGKGSKVTATAPLNEPTSLVVRLPSATAAEPIAPSATLPELTAPAASLVAVTDPSASLPLPTAPSA